MLLYWRYTCILKIPRNKSNCRFLRDPLLLPNAPLKTFYNFLNSKRLFYLRGILQNNRFLISCHQAVKM